VQDEKIKAAADTMATIPVQSDFDMVELFFW
jgi:hypothetical protein